MAYILVLMLVFSGNANAFQWKDLWFNAQQQGQALLPENPAAAAETFKDPDWRGVAHYQAENFDEAAKEFGTQSGQKSQYNLGNAQAKSGQLKEALATYENLLEQDKLSAGLREDTLFNRDLVLDALKQQEQQSQNQPQDQNQDEQDPQDQEGEQTESESENTGNESQQNENDAGAQSSSEQDREDSEEQHAEPESQEADAGANDESQIDESQTQQQEATQQDEQPPAQGEQTAKPRDAPLSEDQQATEQWLRQIPDDPAGLLRRKLMQSHQNQYPEVGSGGQPW